jgi:lysophospholipase L1-like esterase
MRSSLRALCAYGLLVGLTLPAPASAAPKPDEAPTIARPRRVKWWRARVRALDQRLQRALKRSTKLVFLGDSITARWRGHGKAVWARHYSKLGALNWGIGGDETGHLLWRLRRKRAALRRLKPKVVVLLIGVNNAFRRDHRPAAIARGVSVCLREVRRTFPKAKVLLLGLFPAGYKPGPLRGKIAAINGRLAKLADGEGVHYADIGARFLSPRKRIAKAIMHDFVHLTERGYGIWAKAMAPLLKRLISR